LQQHPLDRNDFLNLLGKVLRRTSRAGFCRTWKAYLIRGEVATARGHHVAIDVVARDPSIVGATMEKRKGAVGGGCPYGAEAGVGGATAALMVFEKSADVI
jgi:hypothetical protein